MADRRTPDDDALLRAEQDLRAAEAARSDQAFSRGVRAAMRMIAATPSASPRGARVKATMLLEELTKGDSAFGQRIARGLVRPRAVRAGERAWLRPWPT